MRKDLTKRNHSAKLPVRTARAGRGTRALGGPQSRWARRALVVACLVSPMLSTGCRSGKPGWNLFGRRSEPSAEMLAGSGPTLTYPAPPSAKSTPEAIASIAGGTSPSTPGTPTTPSMGVPGVTPPGGSNPYALAGNQTTPPAYAIPGSTPPPSTAASANPTPSYAAAAANGYAAGGTPVASPGTPTNSVASATNPAGASASAPAPPTTPPSGYQLAGTSPSATPPAAGNSQTETKANAFALPAMNSLTPSRLAGGQKTPGQPASSATEASQPTTPNHASGGGFTLPSGIVATSTSTTQAAPTTPSAAKTAPSTPSDSGTAVAALGNSSTGSSKPEAASSPVPSETDSSPAFQTATATKANSSGAISPAGYTPGSTGATGGYPIQR